MIKYNDDNIYVGQIKQLLHTFNLPRCSVYKEGMQLCPSLHYIKDNGIYLCDKSGNLVRQSSYNYGELYEGITTTLKLTNNVYDSYTHKYLGEYLRFLRDYANVNLMSMYNCFSNELVQNFEVTVNDSVFSSESSDSTVYVIPIKFYNKYSIFANCSLPIEMFAGFYSYNALLDNGVIDNTYARTRRLSLDKPFVYDKINNYTPTKNDLERENCLCLFVKIPYSFKDSLVILEGDYRGNELRDFANGQRLYTGILKFIPDTPEGNTEVVYAQSEISTGYGIPVEGGSKLSGFTVPSALELTSYLNSTAGYLVASRLLEYLTENAITKLSEGYDIKKVQQELISSHYVDSDYLGEWSDEDSDGVIKLISDLNINSKYYDVVGYVDKDVESKIISLPHPNGRTYLE